ncbi:MAG: RimK/LysX family protein [Chloroflexota bacterium]|nr:RimK/LysX family protein [Chloroflexota bacterium]
MAGFKDVVFRGRPVITVGLLALLVALVGLWFIPQGAGASQGSADGAIVIGREETVTVSNPSGKREVEVLAKIDTGADRSSIDTGIAEQLGIDLESAKTIKIASSLGEERRPVVSLTLEFAGRRITTEATVADRSDRSSAMLLGQRDLGGFLIDVSDAKLSDTGGPVTVATTSASTMEDTAALLAVIPLAAVIVVVLRTVIGIETFGLFAPALLALAFHQTGLAVGLPTFGLMLAVGLLIQPILRPLRLHRLARLTVLVATVVILLLTLLSLEGSLGATTTGGVTLPVVVTAGIVERFWSTWEQEGIRPALTVSLWTLLVALLATLVLLGEPVQQLTAQAPYLMAGAGALLAILFGRYRGLRFTEVVRFRTLTLGGTR